MYSARLLATHSICIFPLHFPSRVTVCHQVPNALYQLRPEVQTFSHWPLYTTNTDGNLLNHCACQLFLVLLVTCLESQNLTSVCAVVKSTSTWSASPGLNCQYSIGKWCSIWQQQRSKESLSQAFSEQCVPRLLYVCFCWQLPMGKRYTCSEHGKDDQFTCCNFKRMYCIPPSQHQHSWSRSWCETSSYVERWRWAAVLSFPLADSAGSRPQWLPLSRPICGLTCAWQYRQANFPAVVLFMDEACFIWDFQQP